MPRQHLRAVSRDDPGALIRQRIDDVVAAIRAKDIDGVMAIYARNIVSFDLGPPLSYGGADNKGRAWRAVFAAYTGPIRCTWSSTIVCRSRPA